jgi:hypothetical protein
MLVITVTSITGSIAMMKVEAITEALAYETPLV